MAYIFCWIITLVLQQSEYSMAFLRVKQILEIIFNWYSKWLLWLPVPFLITRKSKHWREKLHYSTARGEKIIVTLWLKNAPKSRHSCMPQAEFEAAVFRFMAQHFNLVIKMVFICTKIFKA